MDPIFIIYAIFVFIISLCIGSFLNVVIYRLPNKMSLTKPASHCPTCNHKIKWYDNIPILSYIILGGKCRYCKTRISPRYLIVEAFTALLCTLILFRYGLTFNSLFGILFAYCLIALSFIDIEHYIIPDSINIVIAIIGIVGIFFNDISIDSSTIVIDYKSKLIAICINVVFLLIIILATKILKKEVMGGGDIKLLFASGLILGWQNLLLSIFIASLIGVIVQVPLSRLNKGDNKNVLPFGPYLAIGFIITYLFGLNIINFYLNLFIK